MKQLFAKLLIIVSFIVNVNTLDAMQCIYNAWNALRGIRRRNPATHAVSPTTNQLPCTGNEKDDLALTDLKETELQDLMQRHANSEALNEASYNKNWNRVLQLIDQDATNIDMITAIAAGQGDLVTLQRLLNHPLAATDLDLNSTITVAAQEGHVAIVDFLLDDKRVTDLSNALTYTAKKGHLPVIQMLLKDQRAISRHQSQMTAYTIWVLPCALMNAIEEGCADVVQCLFEHGANPFDMWHKNHNYILEVHPQHTDALWKHFADAITGRLCDTSDQTSILEPWFGAAISTHCVYIPSEWHVADLAMNVKKDAIPISEVPDTFFERACVVSRVLGGKNYQDHPRLNWAMKKLAAIYDDEVAARQAQCD
jgi:hypothetical protein